MTKQNYESAIAIIGMACRFPGANTINAFWRNLSEGVESITFFPEGNRPWGVSDARFADPNYVRAGARIDDIELFDNAFFGLTPRESEIMDPQHRLFLELGWQVLEDAGYAPGSIDGRVGVYGGCNLSTYLLSNLWTNPSLIESVGDFSILIGNDKDYLTTRVSSMLNLKGPSIAVQTACSTSLVAVHLGCQSLLDHECDMAITGGISISVPQDAGYLYQKDSILSPDGHCRPFDAKGKGTVIGNGAGVVLLKRLEDALSSGDQIHAVILGSAINNDGAEKVGYTAPSVAGQAEVIAEALALGEVDAETVSYIEAHGTATALGDPIEVEALTQVFRAATERRQFCALGSVKSNFGHLNKAAGVAGLIKTVLALKHKQIPPSLHYEEANPQIKFEQTPFYVNTELREWNVPAGARRRAGVSSFGIGGTNAHVVLEEAPEVVAREQSASGPELLLVSARSESGLGAAALNLARALESEAELELGDVAYTLAVGRREFNWRQAVVSETKSGAVAQLGEVTGRRAVSRRPVVLLFPGQGAQYVGMGEELYRRGGVYREVFERCSAIVKEESGIELAAVLYPSEDEAGEMRERLRQTGVTQPAVFVVSYALARQWQAWGVKVAAVLGHSLGEYVGAVLSGVLSEAEGVRLVTRRARLMESCAAGAMLSVGLSEAEIEPLLEAGLSVAAINGAKQVVVSGAVAAVERLAQELKERGVTSIRLETSHGFHSELMEGIAGEFGRELERVQWREPELPYVSSLTGELVSAGEVTTVEYWLRQMREPVRFSAGMAAAAAVSAGAVMLEVGPGQGLSRLARRELGNEVVALASLSTERGSERGSEWERLLKTLGRLWEEGVKVEWRQVYAGQERRRVTLPTYPFERQRFWIEPGMIVAVDNVTTSHAANEQITESRSHGATRDPAATKIERVLTEIWKQGLGVAEVSTNDNFFDLGGHSLLATQIITRIREACRVEISLNSLLEAPTLRDLAQIIARYKAEGRELETERLSLTLITVDEASRYLPFPLTEIQEAYWIGRNEAFELGNVASHMYGEIEMEGFDLERFTNAWRRLIQRHDMLRAIVSEDGQQRVLEYVPDYEIEQLDLRGSEPAQVESKLQAIRNELSHQILPSDRWPLFEIRATRLADDLARLHVSFDYLLADFWSLQTLLKELTTLYLEPGAKLPPLELRFRDYVLGERELRETELYERSLAYWKGRLETLPGAPELPLVKSPGELETPRFVRRRGVLSKESWSGLKERAARAGVTASGVLLAAYAEVLGRWSKTAEFTLNLTLFNRLPLHEEVGQVVGDFTSLTLLEVRQSGGESFELRARRLQEQLWADLDQRYVSGVRVMRELGRARPGARAAAFPVVFTSTLVHDTSVQDQYATPQIGKIVYGVSQGPQIWLDQQVTERGGELWYNWDSLEELFPAGLLDDMVAAYGELLERLSSGAAAWSEVERELLPSWQWQERAAANATAGRESEELLHTLFAQQVLAGPGREAVLSERRGLSYEELLWEAEALSEELLAAGVGVGELVGVVMEKGWEQVVAVLAVLRAGGAYLPIEAGLPAERIEYLLRDGGVQVVLTQPWIGEGVAEGMAWPAAVPRVLAVQERTAAARSEAPRSEAARSVEAVARQWLEERRQGREDLAYVIYTSGSTGTPKGVMITHAGAVNTIVDVNERYGVGAEDRVLGLSSLSFDLSVYDMFGVLGAGGALVLPAESERKEARAWAELVRQYGVTVWNSVPALMQMLVESWEAGEEHEAGAGLRLVLLSGDWVPVRLPAAVREWWGEARVVSMGGATEASIWSILYEVGEVEAQWRSIPYGKPMRNQEFRVVNRNGVACPVWVAGELEIGGAGVALGYWGDAERTQERFRTDKDGARWYRTGDLGRYMPGGEIEFLGREDGQVKVRGHRVELGEISAVLGRHPEVATAVTRAVGEREAGRWLVSYVVPSQTYRERNGQEATTEVTSEFVTRWQEVFEKTYADPHAAETAELNLDGWTSSYSGEPIPTDQMLEWVNCTIDRIRQLKPRRVLEIGCGTGLLLLRLAPDCESYWGTDFAQQPLVHLQKTVDAKALHQVKLLRRAADDLENIGDGKLDLIILNSVVQYFPSVDYLMQVLRKAVGKLRFGGQIFLGDVRSLPLLKLFHASVAAHRASADRKARHVLQDAERRAAHEEELILDPMFFHALRDQLPEITAVNVQLKRGSYANELSKFRYDVVLQVGPGGPAVAAPDRSLHWAHERLTIAKLRRLLEQEKPTALAIHHVPSARIAPELQLLHLMETRGDATVDELRQSVPQQPSADAVQPDDLWKLGEKLLYNVQIEWPDDGGAGGNMTVFFRRAAEGVTLPVFTDGHRSYSDQPLSDYANEPTRTIWSNEFGSELRAWLKRKLPEYMVPETIVTLETLPLTANGKIDFAALPVPGHGSTERWQNYVAPRNQTEETLAQLFAEILDVDKIGIHDNFFELGGHSLMATQLISRMRRLLDVDIALRVLFESPTVSALAEHINMIHWISQSRLEAEMIDREQISFDVSG